MVKKLTRTTKIDSAIIIPHSLASQSSDTNTVEEDYAFCSLHPDYFKFALSRLERGITDSAFSLDSFDNRRIIEVVRKQ
jgi:hypothetical protein